MITELRRDAIVDGHQRRRYQRTGNHAGHTIASIHALRRLQESPRPRRMPQLQWIAYYWQELARVMDAVGATRTAELLGMNHAKLIRSARQLGLLSQWLEAGR